jgi:membrane protease YdiL (CAAX protease family)
LLDNPAGLNRVPALCSYPYMPWDFWLILVVLAIVLPWRGRERMRALLALPEVGSRDRMKLYVMTILFQWALAAAVGWRALARGIRWSELGIASISSPSLLAATVGGAILVAVGHWANVRRMAGSDQPNVVRLRALGARLFPRSGRELTLFLGLAATAGLCEEFLFRGFVMAALLRAGLSSWLVVVVSSVMFGIAHLYQGKGGSMGTAILGAAFALIRLAYGNLLPAVVWHSALDVVAGIAGTRYLVGKVDRPAADDVLNEIHR